MPCQPKIQHFLWRLAHNSLPLKLNMKRRGIDCDTICVCCKRLDEDGAHLFFRCKQVKQVWHSLQLEEIREKMCVCRNAKEVMHVILRLPESRKLLVACLMWRWWTWRNKTNAGDKVGALESLLGDVNYWATESLSLCRQPCTEQQMQPVQ